MGSGYRIIYRNYDSVVWDGEYVTENFLLAVFKFCVLRFKFDIVSLDWRKP